MRDAVTEDIDVVSGGGSGRMLTAVRLQEAGVRSLRIVEQGGDFGGAWHWNRCPGVRCEEDRWSAKLAEKHVDHQRFYKECTPGFLNNEGDKDGRPSWAPPMGVGRSSTSRSSKTGGAITFRRTP